MKIANQMMDHIITGSPQYPDTVSFCEEMANEGKTVVVAALDGTFQRKVRPMIVLVKVEFTMI